MKIMVMLLFEKQHLLAIPEMNICQKNQNYLSKIQIIIHPKSLNDFHLKYVKLVKFLFCFALICIHMTREIMF